MNKRKKKDVQKPMRNKNKFRIRNAFYWMRKHIYIILYVLLLIVLWLYVILNWDKCISMQFFSQFDGNNILFLTGIGLVVIPFFNIEAKEFKITMKKQKEMDNQFQEEHISYELGNKISELELQNTPESKRRSDK